jgi:hypothetical protein
MVALVPLLGVGLMEKVAALAIKCLAVGGGFLAGYALGGAAAWALDKWVFAKKSPDALKKAFRLVTGVGLAIVVALVVFGEGSGGGLFGGGGGDATGKGKGSDTTDPTKTEKSTTSTPPDPNVPKPKIDPVKTPEVKPTDVVIRVTFLGGSDVTGDRYYQLDDEPKTFDELKAAIAKRKESTTQKVYLAVQFPTKNRIAEDSLNVTQVTDWARNSMGIEVLWPGKR